MKFGDIQANVENKIKAERMAHDQAVNRLKGVPEHYDGMEERKTRTLKSTFKLKAFDIVTKPDTIKENGQWVVKTSKRGKPLNITLLYAECEDLESGAPFYFCTRSQKMIEQLEGITEPQTETDTEGPNGQISIRYYSVDMEDALMLGSTEVEYGDGKKYSQPILTPAE